MKTLLHSLKTHLTVQAGSDSFVFFFIRRDTELEIPSPQH